VDPAVRPAQVGPDLRAELVRGHADRDDEPAALTYRALDLRGHRKRLTEEVLRRGDVQESFVERDRLHERGPFFEDRHDRIRCLDVSVEIARHVDAIRAETTGDG